MNTVTKSDRKEGTPQGDAKLSGAVYGIYKGETLVDKYVTDKDGQFTTKEYVCDSDWTIREITPSEGYLLDTTIHKVGAEPKLFTIEHNLVANDVTEQVMKGNIAIIKHTDNGDTQIETPESGATFEIYLKSSGNYGAAEDDERDIIVCDENGFGQTKDMPYGVYTVHQTSGWEGRELMSDFDVFISQNGQTYRYLINNANFESYVKVVKVDAESGKNIPYAGAGFKIYDPEGNQISMSFTYPTPTTIDTFYTDANGALVTPQKLEYGKGYSLVEVQAPYGYVLDSTPVYFDVTQDNSSDEGGVTVIKVDKPNMAQKGTINITKTGEVFFGVNVFGEEGKDVIYQPEYKVSGLAGAIYEVTAAEDIITPDGTLRYHKGDVVDTVTTDNDGFAKSKELYLGKYTVTEIKAPEGMVINKEPHSVELTYAGQDVAVTDTSTSFVLDKEDELVGTLTETSTGIYEMKELLYGKYLVRETKAPEGFELDKGVYSVFINEDEKTYDVENKAGVGFINQAMKGNLKIVKTSSDGKVEGFTFRVTGANGYDRSFTTDKNGEIYIEGLRIGEYTVSEVNDNVSAGYVMPADKKAAVKVGSTTVVEMHNVLRDTPKTGDNSKVGLWTALAGLSAIGIGATAFVAHRKRKKEDDE